MIHIFILAGTANAVPATSIDNGLRKEKILKRREIAPGEKFGLLTIIRQATLDEIIDDNKDTSKIHWVCLCDCGNRIIMNRDNLLDNKHPNHSCGCWRRIKYNKSNDDMIGKSFNHLTIIGWHYGKRTPSSRSSCVLFDCKCDCGNNTYASKYDLETGHKTSCGCALIDHNEHFLGDLKRKDITGIRFGKLVAITPSDKKDKAGCIKWKCKCDCGSIVCVSSTTLINGKTMSCGCTNSRGEEKISNILSDNHIEFKKQLTFNDLRGKANKPYLFDFGILDDYGNVKYIIEYDGEQHYDIKGWNGESSFRKIIFRDTQKDKYCFTHNIPIIRIPYTHYDDMRIGDLLLSTTRFLHSRKKVYRRVCENPYFKYKKNGSCNDKL